MMAVQVSITIVLNAFRKLFSTLFLSPATWTYLAASNLVRFCLRVFQR